jgi:imidazolonepropionase-like amidohydrolase
MSRRFLPIAGLVFGSALATLPAGSAEAPPDLLIRGARVFDGEQVIPSADVLVRGGRIRSIQRSIQNAEGVAIVDGSGKTLLPGFIDAHTHAYGDALSEAIVFGVTTELDMFTDPHFAAAMRKEQSEGGGLGRADLYSAGILVTAPKGHGTEYGMDIPTIQAPSEAQAFVDARIAEGSDWIKIVYDDGRAYGVSIPTIDIPTMKAVIDAAHARKKLAVVHIGDLQGARAAIEAGADGLVHLFVDHAPDDGFVPLVKKKKAFIIPTLTVLDSVAGAPSGAGLVDDARLAPYLLPQTVGNLRTAFPKSDKSASSLDFALETVRRLRAAGVPILAGTDAPNPGTAHGPSIHREMELLVRAGLTPLEALRSATSVSARAFGLSDRGRIASGLRADLVLVNGDPTVDITKTRDIVGIWKRGVAVDRQGFRDMVAKAKRDATAGAAVPAGSESGAVSDFDDGSAKAAFGVGWAISTDAIAGGKSTAAMTVEPGGAGGSASALSIAGQVDGGVPYAWSGVLYSPGATMFQPVNLSGKHAIHFWAKGDGKIYRVMVFSQSRGRMPLTQSFAAPAEWTEVTIPFDRFDGFDGKDLTAVVFAAGPSPGPYAFRIDTVRFD